MNGERSKDAPQATNPVATVVGLHIAKATRLPMRTVDSVEVEAGKGIVGDRYHGTRHRHVTVQSLEELEVAAERHGGPIPPEQTRRNITISRGEVPRQPGTRWCVGPLLLEVVRDAAPCKLLEDSLGRDARRALHRKAGVICRVVKGGALRIGDAVHFALPDGANVSSEAAQGEGEGEG